MTEGLLKILWNNVQGEMQRSLQAGEYEGAVSVAVSAATNQVLLLTLGPLGSAIVSPLAEYLIRTTVPVIRKTWGESVAGQYQVRTTKSDLVVLERPKLVTPQGNLAQLPKHLEIPIQRFITPPTDLIFKPSLRRTPITVQSAYPPKRRAITALEARLTGKTGQPTSILRPDELAKLRALKGDIHPSTDIILRPDELAKLRALKGDIHPLTDIAYPSWVFDELPSLRRPQLSRSNNSSISMSRQYLRQFPNTSPTLNRSFLDRVLDALGDWIG